MIQSPSGGAWWGGPRRPVMEQLRAFARRHLLEHANARIEIEVQKTGTLLTRLPVTGRGWHRCRARTGCAGSPVIQQAAPAGAGLRFHSFFSGAARALLHRRVRECAPPS